MSRNVIEFLIPVLFFHFTWHFVGLKILGAGFDYDIARQSLEGALKAEQDYPGLFTGGHPWLNLVYRETWADQVSGK